MDNDYNYPLASLAVHAQYPAAAAARPARPPADGMRHSGVQQRKGTPGTLCWLSKSWTATSTVTLLAPLKVEKKRHAGFVSSDWHYSSCQAARGCHVSSISVTPSRCTACFPWTKEGTQSSQRLPIHRQRLSLKLVLDELCTSDLAVSIWYYTSAGCPVPWLTLMDWMP